MILYNMATDNSCVGDGSGTYTLSGNSAVGSGDDLYLSFDGGSWTAEDCTSSDLYDENVSLSYTALGGTYACSGTGCL